MRLRGPVCVLLAACALGGCSRDPASDGNRRLDDALSGSAPACAVVWVEGKKLPLDYRGCEAGGVLEGADSLYDCLDGSTIALYGERFYGRVGSRVRTVVGDIADDPAYAEFFVDCVG